MSEDDPRSELLHSAAIAVAVASLVGWIGVAAAVAVAGYQYATGGHVTTLYYVPAFVIIGVGGNLIAGQLEDAAG